MYEEVIMLLCKIKALNMVGKLLKQEEVKKPFIVSKFNNIQPVVESVLRVPMNLLNDRFEVEYKKFKLADVFAFQPSRTVVDQLVDHYTNKFLDYWTMMSNNNLIPTNTLNDLINMSEGEFVIPESDEED